MVVVGPGDHDGAEQLAGDLARHPVRAEPVEQRVVRLGDEQDQAQDLLLGARDAAQDLGDGQRVGRAGHRRGGEAVAAGPCVVLAVAGGGASPRAGSAPPPRETWRMRPR